MEKCKDIVERFSKDICMDFGIKKLEVVHRKGGVTIDSPCVTVLTLLSREDNYMYLGILECDTILMKRIKEASHKEYLARLRAILNASVSAKNTITSIPTYTMPVLWYGFGVLHWTHT